MRIFKSTDDSAPQLTDLSNSLIGVLDGCLVNGYGTVTSLGWTKHFSDVDLAVYKQGLNSNNRYLEVDDSIGGYASVRGYKSWAVDQGLDPFPRHHDVENFYIVKNTNIEWILYGDSKFFYLILNVKGLWENSSIYGFGDIDSFVDGDTNNTIIIARTLNSFDETEDTFHLLANANQSAEGHYLVSNFFSTKNPIKVGKCKKRILGRNWIDYGNSTVPLELIYINEPLQGIIRGSLPKLWGFYENSPEGLYNGFEFNIMQHKTEPQITKGYVFGTNGVYFLVEIE